MRRFLPLTALLLLLVPAGANAATRVIVRGAGWGHGIGMSQYGAYGYALHGRSYRQILRHYFRGTRLSRASTRTVRVLLQASDPYARFRGATRAGGKRLRPATTYVVKRAGGGRLLLATSGGKRIGTFTPPLKAYRRGRPLRLLGPALNGVRGGLYRGALVFVPGTSGGVTAIDSLSLDPYLQGVVGGEMPFLWSLEALKAQAVVARTYALATRKQGGLFDLYPDTRSQMYLGVAGEHPSTNAAVAQTAGQVVTYAGQVVVTYYFSTSGGQTESIQNVFFGLEPRPFLRGVLDPYDDISPRHRWRFRFTTRQMKARLGSYVLGRYRKIRVLQRGVSPRIVRARVYGTAGARTVTGPTLRTRLGLYDSWASFTNVSTSQATARPSAVAALLGIKSRRVLALTGGFEPSPHRRRVTVERRAGGRWRKVGTARLRRGGRYRARVPSPGVYRVRVGSLAGPAVRVR